MMDKKDRILFGIAMLLIIALGLAGNTITIVVLFQKEHPRGFRFFCKTFTQWCVSLFSLPENSYV